MVYQNQNQIQNVSQFPQAIATTPQKFTGKNIKDKKQYILPTESEQDIIESLPKIQNMSNILPHIPVGGRLSISNSSGYRMSGTASVRV